MTTSSYLTSSEFDETRDQLYVANRVQEILEVVNGAALLYLGQAQEIRVGQIYRIDGSGRTEGLIIISTAAVFGRPPVGGVRKRALIPRLVLLAEANANVAKVLRLWSWATWDWVNLYRIFEVVSEAVGGDDVIQANGWASGTKLRKIHSTANNPKASGYKARHGASKETPPATPMTLGAATRFVESMVDAWLQSL